MAQSVNTGGRATCPISFVSWNNKGMNHPVKCKRVLTHLRQLQVDIAFLQETHLKISDHLHLRTRWVGEVYHSRFQSRSRGAALLIGKHVPFISSQTDADPMGRYVIVTGKLYNIPVILATVYAPNWDDAAFFTNFFSQLPDLNEHHLILGGDMNCVLAPSLDCSSAKTAPTSKPALSIQLFLDTYGIADVWRTLHPTAQKYCSSSFQLFTKHFHVLIIF